VNINPVGSGINVVVKYTTGAQDTLTPGSAVLVGPNEGSVTVTGDGYQVQENIISTLALTSLVIDSPLWLDPDQANYQILYGSVDSVDDTANFSTIWDPYVSTGCVPDGTATWFLFAIAFGGLGGLKRCLGLCRVRSVK
jgi:hypothetical protein